MRHLFPPRESFNTYSHLAGAIVALVWLVLLMRAATETPLSYQVSFLIYGVSVILMFLSSAIYHTLNVSDKYESLFQKIDHIMIYIVIAGSYTPICVISLDGGWRLGMLLGVWIFALAGVLKKTFWMNAPRWLSTLIYLFMGWAAVIIFPQLWDSVPRPFTYWIAIGGLFYTFGAFIYGFKRPNPYPGTFGSHEIWHLFVMAGAFSHFWAIYKFLPAVNLSI
ncbi:MAG: hemolysin III family protein [Balneolaceae bacterium]